MKKIACLLIATLLFLLGTSVFAMQKWFLSDYIRWYENEDVAELLYNEYKTGYDEGYEEGREDIAKEKSRSYLSGKRDGISETEEEYQGFAPWWTNLITGASVAVVCSGVFLLIWIIKKKKKTVPAAVKAHPSIPEQDLSQQEGQIQNPLHNPKETRQSFSLDNQKLENQHIDAKQKKRDAVNQTKEKIAPSPEEILTSTIMKSIGILQGKLSFTDAQKAETAIFAKTLFYQYVSRDITAHSIAFARLVKNLKQESDMPEDVIANIMRMREAEYMKLISTEGIEAMVSDYINDVADLGGDTFNKEEFDARVRSFVKEVQA